MVPHIELKNILGKASVHFYNKSTLVLHFTHELFKDQNGF